MLGSTGQIGSALYLNLEKNGYEVWGTTRSKENISQKIWYLDILKEETIIQFPWSKFDIVVDCTGEINYANDVASAESVLRTNVLSPLMIISKLTSAQVYYHCSTHAVLLPPHAQNSYSLSKLFLERYSEKISSQTTPRIVSLRLPGIFSLERAGGVLNTIKRAYTNHEKLSLSWKSQCWHPMYLSRATTIITGLLTAGCAESVVTIGYPVEVSIELLLENATRSFGYSIPVEFVDNTTDHYIPDLERQGAYLTVTKEDLENDLQSYFSHT